MMATQITKSCEGVIPYARMRLIEVKHIVGPRNMTQHIAGGSVCIAWDARPWACIDVQSFNHCCHALLTPLQEAKSETASQQRMALLKPRGSAAAAARPRADIRIQVRGPASTSKLVVASGHLDEVQELARGGTKLGSSGGGAKNDDNSLLLVEAALLGEGAFSRVSEVKEQTTNRTFALKRMTKTAALQVSVVGTREAPPWVTVQQVGEEGSRGGVQGGAMGRHGIT